MRAIQPIKNLYHITVPFGKRYLYGIHRGADFRTRTKEHPSGIGTLIRAIADGKWKEVGYSKTYGNYVILKHENGYESLYGHLSSSPYKEGWKEVWCGDIIGRSGNSGFFTTGPHLHLETSKDGILVDPVKLIEAGNNLKNWARARGIMRVHDKGEISFLANNKLINLNKENCWEILKNNTWGISAKDYKDLENLIK